MILGVPSPDGLAATTLDHMFRRVAARRPDALALVDPPNRESFTDGPPRRFTYAEADRIISAIASRLRDLGLQTDAIVGIQLPNTVEMRADGSRRVARRHDRGCRCRCYGVAPMPPLRLPV